MLKLIKNLWERLFQPLWFKVLRELSEVQDYSFVRKWKGPKDTRLTIVKGKNDRKSWCRAYSALLKFGIPVYCALINPKDLAFVVATWELKPDLIKSKFLRRRGLLGHLWAMDIITDINYPEGRIQFNGPEELPQHAVELRFK